MKKGSILVIGGTGLVGAEVCKHLSKDGYSVIAISRKAQNSNSPQPNTSVRHLTGDISDSALKNSIQNAIGDEYIQAIIVCSGNHVNELEGYREAEQVIHTNLNGLNNLINEIIPSLNQEKPIQLIICSSLMSILPDRNRPAYAATKAAINQWVRSLLVHNLKHVRPVALILGPVAVYPHSPIVVSAGRAAQKIGHLVQTNHAGLVYFPSYLRILSALISISPYLWEAFLHRFKRQKR